jgi:hypothetical protein
MGINGLPGPSVWRQYRITCSSNCGPIEVCANLRWFNSIHVLMTSARFWILQALLLIVKWSFIHSIIATQFWYPSSLIPLVALAPLPTDSFLASDLILSRPGPLHFQGDTSQHAYDNTMSDAAPSGLSHQADQYWTHSQFTPPPIWQYIPPFLLVATQQTGSDRP